MLPAGQTEQAVAPALLKVPAAHSSGDAVPADAQNAPAGQTEHAVAPAALKDPAAQDWGTDEGVAQAAPAGQTVQLGAPTPL
jgi:hypothetical protein